ncbi:MAG: ABC transporter ATP-binding protein [Planctomycetes bacterium]|nr:ABC transporter ATP-binding protein [Planctomycetota bacterium]
MTPLMATRNLAVRRSGRDILSVAEWQIAAGELCALVGPNGSGKTTMLRSLAGVLKPTRGEVLHEGRAVRGLSRRAFSRRVGYLPQDAVVDFEISVRDAVSLGRYAHRGALGALRQDDWAKIDAAMLRLDVQDLADRLIPTLSGGERQRVFLARALAQESDLLLLDEPTTALDVGHQLELMEILRGLHEEGRTLVVAMHDLHLVWHNFTRAVLLDDGRVCGDGPPRELLTSAAATDAFGVTIEDRGGHPVFLRRTS